MQRISPTTGRRDAAEEKDAKQGSFTSCWLVTDCNLTKNAGGLKELRLQTAKQEIRNLSSTPSHKELNSANNLNEFGSDSYNLKIRAQAGAPAFQSCKPGTEKPAGFTRPSDVQNNKLVLSCQICDNFLWQP